MTRHSAEGDRRPPDTTGRYVVGLLFGLGDAGRVALIEKRRPAWMAGRLNGIGGKIEPGEPADQAMRREFREEAGLDIEDWQPFLTLSDAQLRWSVRFYRAHGDLALVRALTDEKIVLAPIDPLPANVMPGMRWQIPLALYPYVRQEVHVIEEWAPSRAEASEGRP